MKLLFEYQLLTSLAIENRFTHNIDNLSMNILMAEQANGRILDADYAYESTRLARSQILGTGGNRYAGKVKSS